jgi:hypothetical protein
VCTLVILGTWFSTYLEFCGLCLAIAKSCYIVGRLKAIEDLKQAVMQSEDILKRLCVKLFLSSCERETGASLRTASPMDSI